MKANPVVAWVSGGGLLAVIALCIILPIALSGGGEKKADRRGRRWEYACHQPTADE